MSCGIEKIIYKLRIDKGHTQKQLCNKICRKSDLTKFETKELMLDPFLVDCLFGRLGKSPAKLKYILSKEMYMLYDLRYKIQKCICKSQFEKARQLLKEYEKMKYADRPLHRQFIEQEEAQIAWIEGKPIEEILPVLESAIERTMTGSDAIKDGFALNAEELKLLLFRWEICRNTEFERPIVELKQILDYSDRHCTDLEEKMKAYPYAVLLLSQESDKKSEKEYLNYILGKALDLLREEGKLPFIQDIIEQYIEVLEYMDNHKQIESLKRERKTLVEIEKRFHMNLGKYRLFQFLNREFELDYEMIRNNREAVGMTQEKLCMGICTQETLSRIETGKRSPSHKNLEQLLEVLNRDGQRINANIMIEDFEVLELKREVAKSMQRLEYDKAEKLLENLEKQIDCEVAENKQYLMGERLKKEFRENNLSYEEGKKKIFEILNLTLKNEDEAYQLTDNEINILNQLAILHYNNGEKEEAVKIYRRIIENYENSFMEEVFHMRNWELAMGNLASYLEEMGELEEAMKIAAKRIEKALEIGKGINLGRTLTTMACILEKKKDLTYKECFYRALDMLHLMKANERYELVKKYIDNLG